MIIFSLVAMTGLEKCCITSAYLQWQCHSGERPVARGPLVVFFCCCCFFLFDCFFVFVFFFVVVFCCCCFFFFFFFFFCCCCCFFVCLFFVPHLFFFDWVLWLWSFLGNFIHMFNNKMKRLYEPTYDKTYKMARVPSKDSDQPGHPPNLIGVFGNRMKKAWVPSYPLSAQQRLWLDLADAQADLSLRWTHMPFMRWFT